MKDWIHTYLTPDDLEKIKQEIQKIEQSTCGEMRLSIREKRSFWEKLYKPHELAVKDFEKLGMANTKYKSGILIFVIFDEHYYDILADEGINEKINNSVWVNIEEKIKEEFPNEGYQKGILHVVDKIGDVLKREFPKLPDDIEELADDVVIH
jgi:uncharacterized membrane protein